MSDEELLDDDLSHNSKEIELPYWRVVLEVSFFGLLVMILIIIIIFFLLIYSAVRSEMTMVLVRASTAFIHVFLIMFFLNYLHTKGAFSKNIKLGIAAVLFSYAFPFLCFGLLLLLAALTGGIDIEKLKSATFLVPDFITYFLMALKILLVFIMSAYFWGRGIVEV